MIVPSGVLTGKLDAGRLATSVRALFRSHTGALRTGLEVEVLPVSLDTHRAVPIQATRAGEPAVMPVLRAHAAARGWQETHSAVGAPSFDLPAGGSVSFEPGGQLEYATAPHTSLAELDADLGAVFAPLGAALRNAGIGLSARGVDPSGHPDDARLQVAGERYARMDRHYARRGGWGRRMMRQTAALHVNIDAPGPPYEAWRVASAAAPALVAAFANSSRAYDSEGTHRSVRMAQWRQLDPTRTGLVALGRDPAADYLDFALDADAFLLGPTDVAARPFREWLAQATPEDWTAHLSTLFPEIRPRGGYLEVRCVDALPLSMSILPAAVLAGLLFDPEVRGRALAELCAPNAALLERAGRLGLTDPDVATLARHVFDLALEGLARVGEETVGPGVSARVEQFRSAFTDRGRDPGDRPGDGLFDAP